MKHYLIFTCTAFILISGLTCKKDDVMSFQPWYPTLNENGEPVSGVFEGKIPCNDCERIKVALVIYKSKQTGLPAIYTLARIYVGKGNERLVSKGNLTITRGIQPDSSAAVYELDSNAPEEFRLFWEINEDLLFMLDENRKPRVGDASHSYVLNRTN